MADVTDNELGEDLEDELGGTDVEEEESAAPGEELFGDVVDDAQQPTVTSGVAPGEGVQLRDSVAGIYDMVKDLEVQLNHMVSINEASERDLEASRKAVRDLEGERDGLIRKIQKMELDAQSSAELREELKHMVQENQQLIEKLQATQAQAEKWAQKRREMSDSASRLVAERDELQEEIDCLEEQISATGEHLNTLRGELARARDARQQQGRKTELIEQRLHVVTEERDALRQELNESRSALEEIKRSIMDTNMQSQMSYYES